MSDHDATTNPPAPDADGAGQPAYGAKPLSPDEALLALAGYMSESKYVCTKCGWSGSKAELREFSANLGPTSCPRCPYMPLEVGPSEQLVKLCDGVRSLLARIAAAEAARDAAVGRAAALADALETLMDEQNGPPLIKYEKSWQAAMDKARAALAAPPAGAPDTPR